MKAHKDILQRAYLLSLPLFGLGIAIVVKLLQVQYQEGPALRAEAAREVVQEKPVAARRGNIYSSDGKLLAASMPVYDLFMDPVTVHQDTFQSQISQLARQMAANWGQRTAAAWESRLRQARQRGDRYIFLIKDLTYPQLVEAQSWPIFRLGRYRGGLRYTQRNIRQKPLGAIAERTIGYHREPTIVGLEGAYDQPLSGQEGSRLMQKVNQEQWKPITGAYIKEPRDGYDVVSTINSQMQDWAHHALKKMLVKTEAQHGCAVVMETSTGAIRAIANLGRNARGHYYEMRNYAVWESAEPGSTFKLASVMAALEDGAADTNSPLWVGEGIYTLYGQTISDSKTPAAPYISLQDAFASSSNVAISSLIYEYYKDQPKAFIDRLYALGLHQRLGLPIKGEGKPYIPTPDELSKSAISLPWMSFGYQVKFTPLQILTLYNAVANDGIMVKPRFTESIRQHGSPVQESETEVLNPAICSRATVGKLQSMLRRVVTDGTARSLKDSPAQLAGKTGTSQQNYWLEDVSYQSSFMGYFPAHDPQYSIGVVITEPNKEIAFYAAEVAAPIFREIAEKIYASTPIQISSPRENPGALAANDVSVPMPEPGQPLPDLSGLDGARALASLENANYEVRLYGNGRVYWQYPPAGQVVPTSQLIELKLQ